MCGEANGEVFESHYLDRNTLASGKCVCALCVCVCACALCVYVFVGVGSALLTGGSVSGG